jgi:hypothetical protein
LCKLAKTVEFRIHVPSKNPIKIMNWIFICTAIVKYAEYLQSQNIEMETIRNVTLNDIIRKVYPYKMSSYLSTYIDYRKTMRSKDDTFNDFTGEREVNEDMQYTVDF